MERRLEACCRPALFALALFRVVARKSQLVCSMPGVQLTSRQVQH
jgi:hypothetical protein